MQTKCMKTDKQKQQIGSALKDQKIADEETQNHHKRTPSQQVGSFRAYFIVFLQWLSPKTKG